ncbi:MAG TPA: glycoside hydrolase family 88 protein, partial [Candidatus Baltobacteraceae bacterium]|nr:glycoside hydrolase family 88 protein [Candidatus Baltobacteraceae bacterium]
MKKITELFQTASGKCFFGAFLLLFALSSGCGKKTEEQVNPPNAMVVTSVVTPVAPAAAPAPSNVGGISDAEIRDVISRVAKHQIRPLADGEYPAATNVEAVKAAKAPEGIAWSYPWGVTLFGMERSTDITGDKDVDKFVVEHNLICARYYNWLASLKAADNIEFSNIIRGSKIGGLMRLGNLDSCGSMGNQILESMMRHPDQVTPEEKAVVERIADWVVNKQQRMSDGTLHRPGGGGTVWPDDLYMGGVFLVRWGIYNHDQKF